MPVLPFRRLGLAALLLSGATLLTGCEQVAIIRSAPVAALNIGFEHKFGNNPLAAADAGSLQQALAIRGQVWGIKLDTKPEAAGAIQVSDPKAVRDGRARMTSLTMTLRADAQATIDGFSSRGPQTEQLYIEALIRAIANAGYTHLTAIDVVVFFHSTKHALLTWRPAGGFHYKVLDGKP